MRKGDIIVNPWVSRCFNGKLNPNYATIYLGNNESLAYTGEVCGWADKVYKDNPDRQTPWKVIGHIDLDTIIETAIREAVKTEPSDSENPNNCETCKRWIYDDRWGWFCPLKGQDECHYEPIEDKSRKCYCRQSCDHYGDKQVCGRCREYNLYSHTKTEMERLERIDNDLEDAWARIRELTDEPQTERSE